MLNRNIRHVIKMQLNMYLFYEFKSLFLFVFFCQAFIPCLRFLRGDMFSEKHWVELFSIIEQPYKPVELIVFNDFLQHKEIVQDRLSLIQVFFQIIKVLRYLKLHSAGSHHQSILCLAATHLFSQSFINFFLLSKMTYRTSDSHAVFNWNSFSACRTAKWFYF